MSIANMAFYPVTVKVPWNLLFFSLGSAIQFFFLGFAIISFFFCHLFHGLPRRLLFGFGCNILWIGIHHWRVGGVSGLLQGRVFLLSGRRMAGRRSRIHE
jgi:1-acyl-sn-glycerol-3-phosphate acyltransferase